MESVTGRQNPQSELCREYITLIWETPPRRKLLTYPSVMAIYDDFKRDLRQELAIGSEVPALSTFCRVFKELKRTYINDHNKQVCLSGSKGAYKRCDICNNVADLLALKRFDKGHEILSRSIVGCI